jgi:hypothetical protein
MTMRSIWLLGALHVAMSAHAAPPPDANGQYRDWFQSLMVPGSSIPCCTVADCRMVESRWNDQTQHHEAKVIRDVFSNALRNSPLYEKNAAAYQEAKRIWIGNWITSYGDVPEAWIEIPDARINLTSNPTGRAVLCWSTFYRKFNGVFCFIPFQAASNEHVVRVRMYG